MSEMESPSTSSEKPSWVVAVSLGRPDAHALCGFCLFWTVLSPWARLFLLPMGYFGIPEVVCFNVRKSNNFSLCLVLFVFYLRIFPNPKVMEIISCIIL